MQSIPSTNHPIATIGDRKPYLELAPVSVFVTTAIDHLRTVHGKTDRNLEVWQLLLSEGYCNKRLSRALHISEPTVKYHIRCVTDDLGVDNRTQAVLKLAHIVANRIANLNR